MNNRLMSIMKGVVLYDNTASGDMYLPMLVKKWTGKADTLDAYRNVSPRSGVHFIYGGTIVMGKEIPGKALVLGIR